MAGVIAAAGVIGLAGVKDALLAVDNLAFCDATYSFNDFLACVCASVFSVLAIPALAFKAVASVRPESLDFLAVALLASCCSLYPSFNSLISR